MTAPLDLRGHLSFLLDLVEVFVEILHSDLSSSVVAF
jgi:hypothetical protein